MREDNRPGIVRHEIPVATIFELKGHILNMLKDIPFFKKAHKDAYKHIDEVIEITDYFNIPNVKKDEMMLRLLPITLKDASKTWLKSLPLRAITTCANLRT